MCGHGRIHLFSKADFRTSRALMEILDAMLFTKGMQGDNPAPKFAPPPPPRFLGIFCNVAISVKAQHQALVRKAANNWPSVVCQPIQVLRPKRTLFIPTALLLERAWRTWQSSEDGENELAT